MAARRQARVGAGLAIVLAVAGCGREGGAGGSGFCTLIGCADPTVSVQVEQPGERPLEACVDRELTGGDELLINLCRIRGTEGLALVKSRRDWFEHFTPIEGLGDDAWYVVTDDPRAESS